MCESYNDALISSYDKQAKADANWVGEGSGDGDGYGAYWTWDDEDWWSCDGGWDYDEESNWLEGDWEEPWDDDQVATILKDGTFAAPEEEIEAACMILRLQDPDYAAAVVNFENAREAWRQARVARGFFPLVVPASSTCLKPSGKEKIAERKKVKDVVLVVWVPVVERKLLRANVEGRAKENCLLRD